MSDSKDLPNLWVNSSGYWYEAVDDLTEFGPNKTNCDLYIPAARIRKLMDELSMNVMCASTFPILMKAIDMHREQLEKLIEGQ